MERRMDTVLVTGCSSGFGVLTALRFARAGHRVVATMRDPSRQPDDLRRAAADGLPLTVLPLDVCDRRSVDAAVRAAGDVDVLVNNAGIELRAPIEDAGEDDVRRQLDTNVFGPLRTMQAVLPAMRARRRGTIVNVSSVAGLVARPFGGFYAASKHALEAITEALYFEVKPFGIRVALVEPGQYATRLLDNAWPGARFTPASAYWETSNRFDERIRRLVPDGKPGDPQEVADVIFEAATTTTPRLRWLAGQDAQMVVTAHRSMPFERYEQAMRATLDWWD
jgi:NAD(P)-dependent dehydrogenase (short-subunit alcohol dehydrogenase family)